MGAGNGGDGGDGSGGGAGAYPPAAVVSSALVACELPPWTGAAEGVAASAIVLLLTHVGGAGGGAGGGGSGGEGDAPTGVLFSETLSLSSAVNFPSPGGIPSLAGTSAATTPAPPSSAALWVEYLAGGTGDTGSIRPSRGPVWGGTPVRLAVGGGWTYAAGYLGAGCRFGAVAVAARWAGAGEVECVTPSRGIWSGRVDAAVTADWRTCSFVPAPEEGRAHFRYVRF